MGGVFISSRRSDSEGHASRLIDRLSDRFGADLVLRDIDTIDPGATFIDKLNRALDTSSVLIAVIGTSWLSVTDATGRRLLDGPDDYTSPALLNQRVIIPPPDMLSISIC